MPAISVIMPVYNAEKYIRKSIESILYQTFEDFELVLIDDCGNDKSMEIARQFSDERIRIIENADNIGISSSRNRGIKESHGKYIALMDDDDIVILHWYEDWLNISEEICGDDGAILHEIEEKVDRLTTSEIEAILDGKKDFNA